MSSTSCKEEQADDVQSWKPGGSDILGREPGVFDARNLGFRVLLGWHYCVLFAPLFVMDEASDFSHVLVARQFTMYLAIACAFAALFFLVRRGGRVRAALTAPPLTIAACIVGAVSTFAAGSLLEWGIGAYLAAAAALGVCEALLMSMWLLMFTTLAKKQGYRTLGIDVIVGALVAMLVQSLVSPADLVVASCLPLLSSVSFLTLKRSYDMRQSEPAAAENAGGDGDGRGDGVREGVAPAKKPKTVAGYLARRCVPAALFAVAFGILQGSFLTDGTAFLIAFNPLLFTGVALAGIIVFFTSERFCTHSDADSMYRLSLVFFMLGVVLLIAMEVMGAQQGTQVRAACLAVADIAVFAGFNLFDFGNMMLCLGIVRTYRGRHDHLVIAGRLVVYAFMTVGVGVGFAIETIAGFASGTEALVVTCCATLIALILTVSLSAATEDSYVKLLTVAGRGTEPQGGAEFEDIDPCVHCNSAPGCTMRPMLEGRVKAGSGAMPSDEAPVSDASRGTEQHGAAKPAVRESAARPVATAEPAEKPVTPSGRRQTPWRAACAEVVRRYCLSRREAEIFSLISKGRNAEYVSTELVISIHTAKTHIANIYQKLGVHSSQEMLDLIDAFRAEIEQEGRVA